ncbi:hypothetical protein D3H65_16315 [Paraflavitalea soli]|uniref:IPT/TIG domain-containing protein n=1 Tax=Paraflavitalea soli TaxID=2315862 RepID=A0A3B7MMT7_9BACT|nr:IPT/TIG domain-containing protein [Paraflavitalea soli]AXY75448.1 hypothetical protein D3H65_16315 [Paraflavitalea soli]
MSSSNNQVFYSRLALALLLTGYVILYGCGKNPANPGPNPAPPTPNNMIMEITSFAPAKGMPGGEVIIEGKNFKDNISQNTVTFNGTPANALITGATTTQLTVRIPQDATTGKIIVKTGNQVDTSATDFIVDRDMISVSGFSPASGPIGTLVTITGINFTINTRIKFNNIECQPTTRTNTSLTFTIPVNTSLTSHKIEVISGAYTELTHELFTVTQTGPIAHWEDKTVRLVTPETLLFNGGVSFVHKNKIYWGFTALFNGDAEASYVMYDPANHNAGWAVLAHPPTQMAKQNLFRPTAVVHNDRVFFGTGINQSTSNKSWWEYHPETNTATQLTDYPEGTAGAISFTLNNKIYTGFGGTRTILYEFNPAANNNKGSWVQATNAPFSELNSGSTVVLGNEVYFGRALPAQLQTRNAFYKFVEGAGITRVTDMPQDLPSQTTASFTIGNKGYFVINKNVWEYTPDAAGGSWRAVIGGDGQPAIKHVAMVTVNGMPVVYGWTEGGHIHEFKF